MTAQHRCEYKTTCHVPMYRAARQAIGPRQKVTEKSGHLTMRAELLRVRRMMTGTRMMLMRTCGVEVGLAAVARVACVEKDDDPIPKMLLLLAPSWLRQRSVSQAPLVQQSAVWFSDGFPSCSANQMNTYFLVCGFS